MVFVSSFSAARTGEILKLCKKGYQKIKLRSPKLKDWDLVSSYYLKTAVMLEIEKAGVTDLTNN